MPPYDVSLPSYGIPLTAIRHMYKPSHENFAVSAAMVLHTADSNSFK